MKMKIALSLAGVFAATAFAPEASAIPAYARQVGMACTACHQQHFPILNSFGRAFKAGGYTMMGAQGKVEGDHLSIPDTLNGSMIIKLRYMKDNLANTAAVEAVPTDARAANKHDGQWQAFDEFALLFGGRVAENVGFFFEGQMLETGPLVGIMRMPFVFDMGAAKLSVVPFMTDGGGPMVGYEMSSGGILRANRWSESRRETSAVQYNARTDTEAATGIAFVAANDMGYINYTKFTATNHFKDEGENSSEMKSSYIRAAVTPTVGDWALVAGLGKMSGASYSIQHAKKIETEQTFIDVQAHGQAGGKELGVYFQRATAPKLKVAANRSAYNAGGATDRTAMTIGADYSLVPHSLHIGAAYRKAENGKTTLNGDNALTLQAIYDLYQNVALHAILTKYSGSAYGAGTANKMSTLMLEMAW